MHLCATCQSKVDKCDFSQFHQIWTLCAGQGLCAKPPRLATFLNKPPILILEMSNIYIYSAIGAFALVFFAGIRIIRPTEKGLIERLGKYHKFANNGFNWIIPIVDRMIVVNITEKMVNVESQEIITSDKLNAKVDAQIYFKIRADEKNVKNSQYYVYNCENQIVNLARTTLRNIIGTMKLSDANGERNMINKDLMKTLSTETADWGIEIVRAELKEINPPEDVQATMNKVVIAENEKTASIPVIMLTALQDESSKVKASSLYDEDYIVKPIAIEDLKARIDATLSGRPPVS